MRLPINLLVLILISPFSIAETLQDKLLNCAKNDDSLQRLVCFDKLTSSLKVAENKTEVTQLPQSKSPPVEKQAEPQIVSPPIAAISEPIEPAKAHIPDPAVETENQEASAVASFGNENKQAAKNLIEKIEAKVTKITKSAFGKYIISLENQQVWRQTDNSPFRIAQGQIVNIKRGAFGSFSLGTEQLNKRIRVKRVK